MRIILKEYDKEQKIFIDKDINIYFDSYEELVSSAYIQYNLKIRHYKLRTIKCGCKPNENLYMSVVENKKEKIYYLKRYDTSKEHDINCLFYSEVGEYIDYSGKEIKYTTKIFEEPKQLNNSNKNEIRTTETNIQNLTYYAYCNNLISSSCSYAFHIKNKNSEELKNFNYEDFINSLNKQIRINNISNVGSLYDFCNKNNGYRYDYGIIDKTLELTDIEDLKDSDIIEIVLDNKSLKTTKKRLEIAIKKLKIFNNLISPSYFYFAIKFYGISIRLYLSPIYFDGKNICFIESNFERNYAKYLYEKNIVFIKPLNNLEFNFIQREKLPGEKFRLNSRPDFITISKNEVSIIEVSGYKNKEYIEQLEDKENNYKKICEEYKYVRYIRVDGVTGEKVLDIKFN